MSYFFYTIIRPVPCIFSVDSLLESTILLTHRSKIVDRLLDSDVLGKEVGALGLTGLEGASQGELGVDTIDTVDSVEVLDAGNLEESVRALTRCDRGVE